ncbi:MAG: hypothetical protein SGPRY_008987 [Prymnesium sp.]
MSEKMGWKFVSFWHRENSSWEWWASEQLQQIYNASKMDHPRLVVHQHHGTPGMNEAFLRDVVQPVACRTQASGCRFTLATTLRLPESHVRSLSIYGHWLSQYYDHRIYNYSFHVTRNAQSSYVLNGHMLPQNSPSFSRGDISVERVRPILRKFNLVGFVEELHQFVVDLESHWGVPSGLVTRHAPHLNKHVPLEKSRKYAAAYDSSRLTEIAIKTALDANVYLDFRSKKQDTRDFLFKCHQHA